jgi:hypothetical protein
VGLKWCVVTVRAVGGLACGASASARRFRDGRGVIAQDFAFVETPQVIGCLVSVIMARAAVPP